MRRATRELMLLLLLAAVPALLTAWWHPRQPALTVETTPALSVAEAQSLARQQSVLWIDARNENAFAHAHIPGAFRLTEDNWEGLLPVIMDAWAPDRTIIVYCDQQTCEASREVATRLKRELQLETIYVLKGGWTAWQQAPKNTP